jgi:hypothetical protein
VHIQILSILELPFQWANGLLVKERVLSLRDGTLDAFPLPRLGSLRSRLCRGVGVDLEKAISRSSVDDSLLLVFRHGARKVGARRVLSPSPC